jgi:hypothetical protein
LAIILSEIAFQSIPFRAPVSIMVSSRSLSDLWSHGEAPDRGAILAGLEVFGRCDERQGDRTRRYPGKGSVEEEDKKMVEGYGEMPQIDRLIKDRRETAYS